MQRLRLCNKIDAPNFVAQHLERNKAILAASMLNTHSKIPSQLFDERDNLHNYLVISHTTVNNNTNDDNLLSQTVTTINRVVVDDRYKPYCCTGIVFNDKDVENEIIILRDTGANLYLIDRQCLEDIETRFTGKCQLFHGVTSQIIDSPMVFQVRSAWINGEIQTANGSVLPSGLHVLLGNHH